MPAVLVRRKTIILERPGRRAVFHVPGDLSRTEQGGTVTISRWVAGVLTDRTEYTAREARDLYRFFVKDCGYTPW